jgi:hypothetical protein
MKSIIATWPTKFVVDWSYGRGELPHSGSYGKTDVEPEKLPAWKVQDFSVWLAWWRWA